MSHYEERLQRDIDRIRQDVSAVASDVEKAVRSALNAVLTLDRRLAYETILGDKPINRAIERIDRQCHYFVARHLPSAGHLRFISSVLRMNVALERIGDYSGTISREAVQLSRPLSSSMRREAERMGNNATQMLHQALRAFKEANVELAKATMYSDTIDWSFGVAFNELVRQGEAGKRSIKDEFGTLVIFSMLQRVGDQAVNICEDTVFALTGEGKQPTNYQILFLDVANDVLGPMAVRIAQKGYPKSATYQTAGRSPRERLEPAVIEFMEAHGSSLSAQAPNGIDWIPEHWRDYHVIIMLEGKREDYLEEVPFRTVALEWSLTPPPASASAQEKRAALEAIYEQLAPRINHLLETLVGEDAS